MAERLSVQGRTVLIKENFGITPANVTRTVLVFGPAKYGEQWDVSRMTLRGSIFTDTAGRTVLPQPTVKVWRGTPGGFLLDKSGPPDDQRDPGKSSLDVVSVSGFKLGSAESTYVEFTWLPPVQGAGNHTDAWDLTFYIEGTILRAVS